MASTDSRNENPEPSTDSPRASSAVTANVSNAIDFLTMARGLKTTKRTGWVMLKVPQVESVADHSWRIALMSMVASSAGSVAAASAASDNKDRSESMNIDTNRCIQMALVHDLAEAAVGDITPHCGVSDTDKHALELEAITKMTETLAPFRSTCAETILELWKEYEQGVTMEAKLVKDMDKLEMILQALEYEKQYATSDSDTNDNEMLSLDQFFTSTRGKWRTKLGEAWAAEIESRRSVARDS